MGEKRGRKEKRGEMPFFSFFFLFCFLPSPGASHQRRLSCLATAVVIFCQQGGGGGVKAPTRSFSCDRDKFECLSRVR